MGGGNDGNMAWDQFGWVTGRQAARGGGSEGAFFVKTEKRGKACVGA